MLVLSRKTNERIHIGNDVVITIVKVKGQTVKVGIEAPRDLRVRRGEHVDSEVESVPGGTENAVPSDTTDPSPDA